MPTRKSLFFDALAELMQIVLYALIGIATVIAGVCLTVSDIDTDRATTAMIFIGIAGVVALVLMALFAFISVRAEEEKSVSFQKWIGEPYPRPKQHVIDTVINEWIDDLVLGDELQRIAKLHKRSIVSFDVYLKGGNRRMILVLE